MSHLSPTTPPPPPPPKKKEGNENTLFQLCTCGQMWHGMRKGTTRDFLFVVSTMFYVLYSLVYILVIGS